jgi:penicillin-insensitive murein endopeptidase
VKPTIDEPSPYPFPPAKPLSMAAELDQRITLLEGRLAPLINLRDGGVSQGGYSDTKKGVRSAIVNASLLPSNIPGLVPMTINRDAHYGSGMLVSFLENAATYLFNQLGLKLFVGDMSLKNGGSYGAKSSHNTHRNGLDADIAWIGSAHPLVDSALNSKGTVVDHFDYEKTWNFLKLAARQEIVQDAQKSTAVSRIFMSPGVKVGFCSWAKDNGILGDQFDAELMRLVRPTRGHDKHFHLSLKCSPHYPLCRNLAGPPPPGTGCAK